MTTSIATTEQANSFDSEIEIWKPVKGYDGNEWAKGYPDFEGLYEVSSCGKVRSVSRKVINKPGVFIDIEERILSTFSSNSYERASLWKNGISYGVTVHSLVARAFLPPCPGVQACRRGCWTINHIDRNKTNNHYKNLEWMMSVDNVKDGFNNKKPQKGEHAPRAKLTTKDVLSIRNDFRSYAEIAKDYNLDPSSIKMIIKNINWSHIPYPNLQSQLDYRSKKCVNKLSHQDVINIRNDDRYLKDIAKDYNISPTMVSKIKKKQSYSYVN